MPEPTTPPLEGLTPSQQARRQRMLAAAADLASRGGYDAVQMREIAEIAEVALGTVYRYFPSKVHLLVATMHEQTRGLRDGVLRRPPTGGSAFDRVMTVMRRANRALERDPKLTGAMLRATMFADASAASEVSNVNQIMTDLITQAILGDSGQEATAEELAIARVIEQVWLSSLLTWLAGRSSVTALDENLEVATRLLLRGKDDLAR